MKKTPKETPQGDTTRREFITQAVFATSAVALAGVLPTPLFGQSGTTFTPLLEIGEIAREKGLLKGIIRISNGTKVIPGWTTQPMLRFFEGLDQQNGETWPAKGSTACLPGPTLRARVGDRVELTLINKVKVGQFGGSLDQAETGATDGCDHATNATLDQPDKKWYPNTRG